MPEFTIVHYTENGKDMFTEWLKALRDKRGSQ